MNVHIRVEKKRIGSFYTPLDLAGLITKETLCSWLSNTTGEEIRDADELATLSPRNKEDFLSDVRSVKILDPAAGDGAFLLEAAKWLDDVRSALGDPLEAPERRAEIVEHCLYGVDVVPEAVSDCRETLCSWATDVGPTHALPAPNVLCGNSLVGRIGLGKPGPHEERVADAFHWAREFPEIIVENGGFDIILGNPPYGNILSQDERDYIAQTYTTNVGGNREGTWNAAAHFIVRASALLTPSGTFGLLVPNSILRVTQFQKTRRFLMSKVNLWKIIDEASPFDDVTLEMVSLFARKDFTNSDESVQVESRRPGQQRSNAVPRRVLSSSRIFPIYHDAIHAELISVGKRELLTAKRGRDIPKGHVSKQRTSVFRIPYLTSGRSVKRYRVDEHHLQFADDWFLQDAALRFSFENELLISTKNYPYPRCVVKPRGVIHGGGIVRISGPPEMDIRALGMILNSELVRFVSVRYLTNYSELTTCLNTGIMNDLPLVLPEEQPVFHCVFDALSSLHSTPDVDTRVVQFFERLGNALTYDLFFGEQELQAAVKDCLDGINPASDTPSAIYDQLGTQEIAQRIGVVMRSDLVRTIRKHLN